MWTKVKSRDISVYHPRIPLNFDYTITTFKGQVGSITSLFCAMSQAWKLSTLGRLEIFTSVECAVLNMWPYWIKRDQLDVTCFFISIFNAHNVSDVSTSTLRSLRLICWVISWVVLLCKDRALAYLFSGECLVVTCVVVIESVFLQILAAAVSYGYWVLFLCV